MKNHPISGLNFDNKTFWENLLGRKIKSNNSKKKKKGLWLNATRCGQGQTASWAPRCRGSNRGWGRSQDGLHRSASCTWALQARMQGPLHWLTDDRGLRCAASSPGGQQNNREALTAFVYQVTKYRNKRRGNRSSQASARGSFLPQGGRRTGSRVPAE